MVNNKIRCPSCGGITRNHYEVGLYCVSCGLILSTYEPVKKKTKNPRRVVPASQINGMCFGCGAKKNLTRHHIIPKRIKRIRNKRNLIILCRDCHNIADRLASAYYEGVQIIKKEKVSKIESRRNN